MDPVITLESRVMNGEPYQLSHLVCGPLSDGESFISELHIAENALIAEGLESQFLPESSCPSRQGSGITDHAIPVKLELSFQQSSGRPPPWYHPSSSDFVQGVHREPKHTASRRVIIHQSFGDRQMESVWRYLVAV